MKLDKITCYKIKIKNLHDKGASLKINELQPGESILWLIWWNSLSNSNYLMSAKKCRCKSCIIDFTSAKMEFALAIFKKMYFSKYWIKYVVNRLPPFKDLYDHTNRFLKW